jgi:hypothetical protein
MPSTRKGPTPAKEPILEVPREVEFKYVFPDQYNPVYANGAFGGPTPRREIAVNFFVERPAIPRKVTHALAPVDGEVGSYRVGGVVAQEPTLDHPYFVRFVTTGVVMTVETAKVFHAWLGEQIQQLDGPTDAGDEPS